MNRSSSNSRVSDRFFIKSSPSQSQLQSSRQSTDTDQQQKQQQLLLQHERLPTYDPLSHAAKIERSRLRSTENVIHAIPLVLVLCAIILRQ